MDYAMLDGRFDIMPNKESITLTPMSIVSGVTTEGTAVSCTGYRKQLKDQSLAQGATFQNTNEVTLWVLRDSTLDSNVPKMNDVITDAAGLAWTVNSVTNDGMGSRWTCNCTRRK